MTSEQSRKLAAVWFADIVGYTSLSARNEDAAIAGVEVLQRLARQIVDEHDGKIVKFVGDAVLVVFDSVEAALRSALTLQDQFSQDERVRERFYAARHTKIGESLNSLAMILDERGEKEEAAETYRRALAITEAVIGVDNLTAAIHRNNLARHLCTFGKATEGVRHSAAAVRIADGVLDEGFFVTGIFRSTQGFCLGAVGRFSRAEEVLRQAMDILEAALGPDSSHSVTVRGRLAQMYDDWGKPDLAAEMRSR